MGTVLEKANKIKETKNKLKEVINIGGGQITDDTIFSDYANEIKDIYTDAISNGVDNIYNNFPKVIGEGSEIILDTEEAPMKITLEGNTSQKTSILPKEYTQVDYIQSSGTQYIDTNYYCNPNTKIEIEFKQDYINLSYPIFGNGDEEENGLAISLSNQSGLNSYRIYCGDDYPASQNIPLKPDTNKHLFVLDLKNEIIKIDSNSYNMLPQTTNPRTNNSINSLLIFTNRDFDGSVLNLKSRGRLYSAKIYNNNILVRDIIPCYRNSDNVIGMYDLITDTFYTNQGTGVFTYGSVVTIPNPDYPQDIKVVTGEQSINMRSKNLFDYTKHNALTLDSNGRITTTEYVNQDNTVIYKLKPNTKYTFSFRNSNMGLSNYGLSMTLNGTWVQTNSGKYTVTSDSNGEFAIKIGAQSYPNIGAASAYIQLEEGTSVTSYTPYQLQAYPISLGDIELCKINDYKDYIFKNVISSPYYNADLDLNEWYLHKEIGKITLSNSDSFTLDSYSLRFTKVLDTIYKQGGYSNRYIYGGTYQATGKFEILRNSRLAFNYPDSNIDTVAELQTYLTTNELYMYLPLSTPTNTKITDTTLIAQLENINNNAHSYLSTTIIKCSSLIEDNEIAKVSTIALKNINLIESE